ncbi:DUF4194 domain-containing protein [Tessaracoccus coleopterorum]|uniref:DUF4194 domain-containing protein n=1 Tax=Tessaracoccus coleopterorum TaxID=2714950 RepID=UPI001E3EECF4|nr:DUF4194 domain-containing protein [Tessaracoccus coleopterorum]
MFSPTSLCTGDSHEPEQRPRRADGELEDFDDAEQVEAPEDPGELDPATRRLLLKLLNGPYVRAEEHAKLWAALERSESVVRSRLADLYLQLVIDRDAGVAFVRNLALDDARRSCVASRSPPRHRPRPVPAAAAAGRPGKWRPRLRGPRRDRGPPAGFLQNDSTDKKAQEAKVGRSIAKMTDNSILLRAEVEDRWEISPVLRLVFGADEVAALTADLERMAAQ